MKFIRRILIFPLVISCMLCAVFPLMLVSGSPNNVSASSESDTTIVEGTNNTEDIDISLPSYKQKNPLWPMYNGQCTWYCWARANQLFGVSMPTRNAKYWYELAKNMGFKVGNTPSKNSIMVQTSSTFGHVAYVEGWDGENITLSEANVWHGAFPADGVGLYASDTLALAHMQVSTSNYNALRNRLLASGRGIAGFIYLE